MASSRSERRSYGDHAGLLEMLRLPIGQAYFARFAKREAGQTNLLAWFDSQEFKTIPAASVEFRQHKAREIVRKYVAESAPMRVDGIAADARAALERLVEAAADGGSGGAEELPSTAFDALEEAAVRNL